MTWEKIKVSDVREGDNIRFCGLWWAQVLEQPGKFYNDHYTCQLPLIADVEREVKVTEPKPKRYIVEVRPPKKGERLLDNFGTATAGNDFSYTSRVVIVEELA